MLSRSAIVINHAHRRQCMYMSACLSFQRWGAVGLWQKTCHSSLRILNEKSCQYSCSSSLGTVACVFHNFIKHVSTTDWHTCKVKYNVYMYTACIYISCLASLCQKSSRSFSSTHSSTITIFTLSSSTLSTGKPPSPTPCTYIYLATDATYHCCITFASAVSCVIRLWAGQGKDCIVIWVLVLAKYLKQTECWIQQKSSNQYNIFIRGSFFHSVYVCHYCILSTLTLLSVFYKLLRCNYDL